MRLDDFDEAEGKRVWLSQDEIELLVSKVEHEPVKEVAFTLGARTGLRREEITKVTPNDFNHAPRGFLRVWSDYAKRDKYRESPTPMDLSAMIRGIGGEPDEPVVDVHPSTVYRWVRRAAQACQAQTNDPGWQYLTPHDLRRTWGGHLLWNCGVLPFVVMSWGGWDDWTTFKDAYMGEMSPEAASRERSKIYDDAQREDPLFEPTVALP